MNPIDAWHGALLPEDLTASAFERLSARMRAERLTFGDRVHCPFLRPLFLTDEDERRIREFAETLAVLGERVVTAAMASPSLLEELGLRPDERRLIDVEPGYARASTSSRVDTFLLPDSLQAAEYNAESPAGFGYTERLAGVFEQLPVMARFKAAYDVQAYSLTSTMLDALMTSYRDWGGTAHPPTIGIVDWRDVPTWSEFEILQERFTSLGVPTIVCTPQDLEFDGRELRGLGTEDRPAVPARAHERHHEPPCRVRGPRARVRGEGRVHGQLVPLQDPPQEGVLRRADGPASCRPVQRAGAPGDRAPRAVDPRGARHADVEGRGGVRSRPVGPAEPQTTW